MTQFFKPIALILLSLTGILSATAQNSNADFERWRERYQNGIAAVVEGRIITKEEIRVEMAPIIPQLMRDARSAQDFNAKVDQLAREILQNKIDRQLIIKDFYSDKKRRIPKSVIDNEFTKMIQRDFEGDRSKLLQFLDSQNKTIFQFRKEMEEDIIVSIMRGEMRKKLAEVSPQRIEAFYQQNKLAFYSDAMVHLRQIQLAPLANESEDVVLQNAERIIAEFRAGADFSDLARRFSQDDTRRRGGDMGWIKRSEIRQELSDIAFGLGAGEISKPIRIGSRVFVLYAEDARKEMIQPMEEVRDQIDIILSNNQASELQQRWITRLRERGYVRYFL